MALLPDVQQMEQIERCCLAAHGAGERMTTAALADRLMSSFELPMHSPYHHYLVPAVLLTVAAMRTGTDGAVLKKQLGIAKTRAGAIPGGTCGQYGCCGAALGAGIFAAVLLGTTPLSKHGWSAANAFTARCLAEVAAVEGPRCCKRVTYLTLRAAHAASVGLLGLDLGEFPAVTCRYSGKNRECRGEACPFFGEGSGEGGAV